MGEEHRRLYNAVEEILTADHIARRELPRLDGSRSRVSVGHVSGLDSVDGQPVFRRLVVGSHGATEKRPAYTTIDYFRPTQQSSFRLALRTWGLVIVDQDFDILPYNVNLAAHDEHVANTKTHLESFLALGPLAEAYGRFILEQDQTLATALGSNPPELSSG